MNRALGRTLDRTNRNGARQNEGVSGASLGDPRLWPDQDLIGWSAGLSPAMTIDAYAQGAFPMPIGAGDVDAYERSAIGWFSPLLRGILPLDGLRVTRSLRQSSKRYRVSVDTAFAEVVARCADPGRDGAWIDEQIRDTYLQLHELGVAHSVECWDGADRLVGGLYGVSLGGLFAGESMFHDPQLGRDASKVALVFLVDRLKAAAGARLLDVQWRTPHLASLGVVEVTRSQYLRELAPVLATPAPPW